MNVPRNACRVREFLLSCFIMGWGVASLLGPGGEAVVGDGVGNRWLEPLRAGREEPAEEEEDPTSPNEESGDVGEEEDFVTTRHEIRVRGALIRYEATAGALALRTEEGKEKARLSFFSYVRQGVSDSSPRPLTFVFNGGPGSSSVWLHLGAFGPRVVVMDDQGFPLPPPSRLVDNEDSILDVTDLVFLDPVTTGYSRPAKGENPSQFHGLTEDVEWVGEFIRLFVTKFRRWDSPKFLAGESYGTTRAAALAEHLQQRHGMYLNGVILVSSVLDFQTLRFDVGNDLPPVLYLPTYTATAWFHRRLDSDLQRDLKATLREVEAFCSEEYTVGLMKGDLLPDAEKAELFAKLARYTGLTEEVVSRMNGRIQIGRFVKELLRSKRRTVGRLDSRFQGIDADAAGERFEFDPSYAAIQGPYTSALNLYVRAELGYENDLPYEILTGRVRPWSYADFENRYVNVAENLRRAMNRNRDLKIYVASGYYDLATPYFATDYTLRHLGLEPELRRNIRVGYFESGHMMYIRKESRAKLRDELVAFFEDSVTDD